MLEINCLLDKAKIVCIFINYIDTIKPKGSVDEFLFTLDFDSINDHWGIYPHMDLKMALEHNDARCFRLKDNHLFSGF